MDTITNDTPGCASDADFVRDAAREWLLAHLDNTVNPEKRAMRHRVLFASILDGYEGHPIQATRVEIEERMLYAMDFIIDVASHLSRWLAYVELGCKDDHPDWWSTAEKFLLDTVAGE